MVIALFLRQHYRLSNVFFQYFTMPLTSELKNPDSQINQLLDSILPYDVVTNFIVEHNAILETAHIIPPQPNSNLLLVGSAMAHAFYYQITGEWGFYQPTMARLGFQQLSRWQFRELMAIAETAKTPVQKALIALAFAYFEGVGRGNNPPDLRNVVTQNVLSAESLAEHMNELGSPQDPLMDTVYDIANLMESFNLKWVDRLNSKDVTVNASFSGSHLVGGADAQMISNGILIDIKTSKLRQPFTQKDLYQQLAYWLLDYDNQYNIKEIVWVYPRHQMFLRYGIDKMFPQLPQRSYELLNSPAF